MLQKHEFISHLVREFPQFWGRWAEHSGRPGHDASLYLDLSLFVSFVTDELYEKENHEQVHTAFEQMEQFLKHGNAEVRELVVFGFFETLRIVTSWKPYGSDAFIPFLRPESRSVWAKLDAVWNLNLDDCSVLEGEVLVWRVLRQSLSHQGVVAQ